MTITDAPFIRPDGKEKVTGLGRYTADLNLTGQAHAAFRYADHPARPDHPARRLRGPGDARGLRRRHPRGRPREPLRRHGPGPAAVRQGDRPLGGRRRRRRRRARTQAIARAAAAAIEVEYEVLPALPDYVANAAPDAPLVHPELDDVLR